MDRKALTLLQTHSHKLDVAGAPWKHHADMKISKVCNENLVEDEYHLLITCLAYKIIRKKYEDLLDGHDNMSVMLKFPP